MEKTEQTINLDELVVDLKSCDFRHVDDTTLCQFGLKLRVVSLIAEQMDPDNLSPKQRELIVEALKYNSIVEKEMSNRGYRVMDSSDLSEMSSEEIRASLMYVPMQTLVDWYEELKHTTCSEEDAHLLLHLGDELMRRSLENCGGIPS